MRAHKPINALKMKKKAPKTTVPKVTCEDCKFAYLMRSAPENPIVVLCLIDNHRDVATWPLRCKSYIHNPKHHVIHDMVPVNLPFNP